MLEQLAERVQTRPWANRGVLVVLCLMLGVAGGLATAAISPLIGFAVILTILLAMAIITNIQIGLLTVITIIYLLPFGVIPLPIGDLKLTFLDATLSIVLALWLLRLLTNREEKLVGTPLDGLILLFIGLAIVSFVIGITSVTGEIMRFFLKALNSILFFFSVTNIVRQTQQLEQVIKTIMLGGFSAAFISLVLYLLSPDLSSSLLSSLSVLGYPPGTEVLRYIAGTDTLRAIGTSIDPNILGGMLLLTIPVTAAQLFGKVRLLPRSYLAISGLTMVIALILTYSRSSWGGAVAAVLFIATFRYRKIWFLLVPFLILLFLLPQGEFIVGRIASGLTAQDQAAAMRLGEYKDALRLISLYPWFGVGFGSAPSIDLYVAASSIYLLMAGEMGLVGLSVFLILLLVFFAYTFNSTKMLVDPSLQTIQVGCLAAVVGALTAGISDHYFFNLHFPHTVALFWLYVALTVVATRLGKLGFPQSQA